MSERDYAPLSTACVRGLCDKLYEKRKFAGVEIEKMVKDFSESGNWGQIARLIRVLGQDLMASTNSNVKNGALMGLSSVAVGLGKGVSRYCLELIAPIVACFSETESRVRYQAAEALYNVVKVARGDVLPHFALVFDALARLVADPEQQVRQAAELLDRLLKDIVTESENVDVSALVSLIRERAYARGGSGGGGGGAARQFVAAWVCVLDAVPSVELTPHLPDLLDPLFRMLDDPNPEIRRIVEVQLGEFLRSICRDPSAVELAPLLSIVTVHAQASDELVQLTGLCWLRRLGALPSAGAALRARAANVLQAALPCLAYDDPHPPKRDIREAAVAVNQLLMSLVTAEGERKGDGDGEGGGEGESEGEEELDVGAVVAVLTRLIAGGAVPCKEAALEWVLRLYACRSAAMGPHTAQVFPAALAGAAHPHTGVVRRCLAVLAEICSANGDLESSPYYGKFLKALLRMFEADEALLEDRGAFIVRQLCVLLGAERVYVALARAVRECGEGSGESESGGSPRFAAAVVDMLGAILLTAAELHDLRRQLRRFDDQATRALFRELYMCWCHSAVPLLALCLLTHNYHHCNQLIATFGDLEITVDFLTEVDKLVQLIESPIFAYLRLELLGPDSGPLRGALFGLLMLLPQGEAFHTLRRRLQCAPPPPPPPSSSLQAEKAPVASDIDFAALLEEFVRVQAVHRARSLECAR